MVFCTVERAVLSNVHHFQEVVSDREIPRVGDSQPMQDAVFRGCPADAQKRLDLLGIIGTGAPKWPTVCADSLVISVAQLQLLEMAEVRGQTAEAFQTRLVIEVFALGSFRCVSFSSKQSFLQKIKTHSKCLPPSICPCGNTNTAAYFHRRQKAA